MSRRSGSREMTAPSFYWVRRKTILAQLNTQLVRGGGLDASPPRLDLELEGRVQEACLKIIQAGLVESAS